MRYFAEMAYKGTHYHGWQRQQNAVSVQAKVEEAFSTILNLPTEVTGCGRTDTGVHASQYFFHFDCQAPLPENLALRANLFLPKDIAIRRIFEVPDTLHARYDAVRRSYEYHIVFEKSPFETETAWHFHAAKKVELLALNQVATLLLRYREFAPFCKTNHDADTLDCDLHRCEWNLDEQKGRLVFYVTANRFLRGMVRLMVGACLNVATGKLQLEAVRQAMEQQTMLEKSWSVPPEGLFLTTVQYREFSI